MAIPLFGASGAQAASADIWDKVAECESGNNWSANEGTGYYGGLQLSVETWEAYGGKKYAPRPDLASRRAQLAVAEKVLADVGPEAWPSCSLAAGLTEEVPDLNLPGDLPSLTTPSEDPYGGKSPDPELKAPQYGAEEGDGGITLPEADLPVKKKKKSFVPVPDRPWDSDDRIIEGPAADIPPDAVWEVVPGPTGTPEWTGGSGGDGDSAASEETVVIPVYRAADAAAWNLVPEPDYQPELTRPVPKHAGAPADENGDRGENRPSRGKHRVSDSAYTVAPGDSLAGIAEREDVEGGWRHLYDINRDAIGSDPDVIAPGTVLDLG